MPRSESSSQVLRDALGLIVESALDLDTDRFGTFGRDFRRTRLPFEAARAKIAAGFDCDGGRA